MYKPRDITGMRFGRLVAVEKVESHRYPCGAKLSMWKCRCDCGNEVILNLSALTTGNTSSCGCFKKDVLSQRASTHHESHSRLHELWKRIKARCNNPNTREYRWYGAKGVTVCKEWSESYTGFRDWALANGYDPNAKRGECTIDRINPYGNYEPSNCRFVPMSVQLKNQRKHYDAEHCG